MNYPRILHKSKIYIVILLLLSVSMESCRDYRYRKMIKKRRIGYSSKSRHKSAYQKKLNKKVTQTNSKYVIDNKRNYRRRPWYNN